MYSINARTATPASCSGPLCTVIPMPAQNLPASGDPSGPAEPALRNAIARELETVRNGRDLLLAPATRPIGQAVILILCILVNGIFILFRPDYISVFVAASFYLNMGYFITLLIPTTPGSAQAGIPAIAKFQGWLAENGIRTSTDQFTRIFINAFFMNSRALSLGIGLLFSIDILFVLIAYGYGLPLRTTIVVIAQSAIIILFYFLVWKTEPFTSHFSDNIDNVRDRLSRDLPEWLISFLFMVGFLLLLLLFLTTIILTPGITLDAFVTQSGLTELAHRFIPIGILVVTQYFLIRYIHGVTSRVMAGRLIDHRMQALGDLLAGTGGTAAPAGGEDYGHDGSAALLESRIYVVKRNTLLGMFPVFVVDLDFSVLLDSTTQRVIRGYIRKR